MSLSGAIFQLNQLGHFVSWHWLQISYANLIVIGLMVMAFIVALVAPFPGRRRRGGGK